MATTKIWNVNSGPYEDELIENLFFMECLLEDDDGNVFSEEIYLPTLEYCHELEKYFKTNLGPLTIDEFLDMMDE